MSKRERAPLSFSHLIQNISTLIIQVHSTIIWIDVQTKNMAAGSGLLDLMSGGVINKRLIERKPVITRSHYYIVARPNFLHFHAQITSKANLVQHIRTYVREKITWNMELLEVSPSAIGHATVIVGLIPPKALVVAKRA